MGMGCCPWVTCQVARLHAGGACCVDRLWRPANCCCLLVGLAGRSAQRVERVTGSGACESNNSSLILWAVRHSIVGGRASATHHVQPMCLLRPLPDNWLWHVTYCVLLRRQAGLLQPLQWFCSPHRRIMVCRQLHSPTSCNLPANPGQ